MENISLDPFEKSFLEHSGSWDSSNVITSNLSLFVFHFLILEMYTIFNYNDMKFRS